MSTRTTAGRVHTDPARRAALTYPTEMRGITAHEQGEFVNITQSLRNLLDTVIQFLPKLVAFLVILLIGYFIAKLLQKVVDKLLEKVGFDRAVERGGVKKALEKSQYDASDILAKIVFYAVMLFVLSTA